MEFSLTPEQIAFKKEVAKFAEEVIAPGAAERDLKAEFGFEEWKKMGEYGLLGLPFPEEYGGGGAGVLDTCLAMEAFMYGGGDAGMGLSYGAHTIIGSVPIWQLGTEEQKKKYLPKVCSGEWIAGLGLTEPDAGSDAGNIQTTAVRNGDVYILNGTKMFITNGPIGQVFVCLTATDKDKGHAGITGFIVESSFPGFRVGKELDKMGNRSSPTSELIFEDCEVPAANMLGEENNGFMQVALATLEWERGAMIGGAIGGMERMMEECMAYAKERKQFGRPISSFQAIQFKLADMKVDIETTRLLIYKVAWLKDQGKSAPLDASIAKLYMSEAGMRVADQAVQIFGGYGYIKEQPIERVIRDAKLATIGAGTSEIQRWLIARLLLGGNKGYPSELW